VLEAVRDLEVVGDEFEHGAILSVLDTNTCSY
jgi:hypothetical protein